MSKSPSLVARKDELKSSHYTKTGKHWVNTPLDSPPVGISSSQQVVLARFLTAADKAAALLVAALLYCTEMLYTSADDYTAALHCCTRCTLQLVAVQLCCTALAGTLGHTLLPAGSANSQRESCWNPRGGRKEGKRYILSEVL